MPGRMDDMYREPIRGQGSCTDCQAVFEITLYPSDSRGVAFVRDHPQNGCHVKYRQTIATKPLA